MSSNKSDKNKAEEGIRQAGAGVTAASKMTPKETAQYESSFDIGNLLRQIMQYQQGLGQAPEGYLSPLNQYLQQTGPLGSALYGQTLQGVQDPNALYESTLRPQLQLAEDYINRGAQQRGLLRSGIPIEQMGRAGVDLAIAEAQARLQNRQTQLANAQSLGGNIQNTGQTNLANLANLYGQQQSAGLSASGRQATGAAIGAQYQSYPYQASLANAYSQPANLGAGIGGGLGAGVGFFASGGNPYAAMIGYGAGSNLGRSFF